jgi:hypothetical protein
MFREVFDAAMGRVLHQNHAGDSGVNGGAIHRSHLAD